MRSADRGHRANRVTVSSVGFIGQLIFFCVVSYFVPVAIGGPDGVDVGIAICIGVLARIFSVIRRNVGAWL